MLKKIILYILGNLLSCSIAWAQTDSLLMLAESAIQKEQYKDGLRYYLQAAKQAEDKKNTEKLTKIYTRLADIYESGELYDKALEYLKKIHEIAPTNDLASRKADILTRAGKYQDALKIYSQLAKTYQTNNQTDTYKRLGILRKIVVILQKTGDYDSALDNNLQILEIQQNLKDTEGIIIATNNVGYTYKYMKKYTQAIRAFQDVMALEQKAGGKFANNPTSRINLGVTYQNIDDYESCLRYLDEASEMIKKDGNKRELAKMYELLATAYFSKKDYYNARVYNDLALALAKETNDMVVLEKVYETSSMLYQKEEKFDKALDDYKKHLSIRDSLLTEMRLRQNEFKEIQLTAERTEKEIKLLATQDELKTALIAKLEEETIRKNKELELLDKQSKLDKESLKNQENAKKTAEQELLLLRQKSEAEKKDRAIELGRQREELQNKEIERKSAQEKQRLAQIAGLEKDKKFKELELKNKDIDRQRTEAQQREARYATMGIMAVVSLISIFFFIGLLFARRKNKQLAYQQTLIQETNAELVQTNEEIAAQRDLAEMLNKQVAEKNAELVQTNEEIAAQRDHAESLSQVIGEKNESIMASILYAQRIQQAILVTPDIILQDLPNHFMVFMPRDIVSGDFYFFANTDGKIIISAIDCTGHGVPGAFMSMIGHEILEDITIMRKVTSPDIILNELHKGIRKALKQEQTNNRDGMDLSLVTIDKENKILEFAGAKNPLIYIKNNEINLIKGDKMPIGGEQRETTRAFTKHQIPLDEPITFYLFTDGYQDQFGGKENKKYTIGRMKETFLQIHEQNTALQKETIQTNIQAWMEAGKEYQIDDILVIGVQATLI